MATVIHWGKREKYWKQYDATLRLLDPKKILALKNQDRP